MWYQFRTLLYVTVTLQRSLTPPVGRAFVVTLTAPGLVAFAVGVESVLAVRVLNER